MNSTKVILEFLSFLATTRAIFREVHIFSERSPALRDVSTSVMPFKCKPSDYADEGVTISIALNAELRTPLDSERQAIGMSCLLRHAGEQWHAEVEVGWTGAEVGWDDFESWEAQAISIEEIESQVPPLVELAGARFRAEVATLVG